MQAQSSETTLYVVWVGAFVAHMKAVMTGSDILISFGQVPMDMYPEPKLMDLFLDPAFLPESAVAVAVARGRKPQHQKKNDEQRRTAVSSAYPP